MTDSLHLSLIAEKCSSLSWPSPYTTYTQLELSTGIRLQLTRSLFFIFTLFFVLFDPSLIFEVILRDIKPENMGLSGDGQLRLLDLGLSVRLLSEWGQKFPVWDCAAHHRDRGRQKSEAKRVCSKIGTP